MNARFIMKAVCLRTIWSGVAAFRSAQVSRRNISEITTGNGWEYRCIFQPLTISLRDLGVADAVKAHLKNVSVFVSLAARLYSRGHTCVIHIFEEYHR